MRQEKKPISLTINNFMTNFIYINGQYFKSDDAKISFDDGGFQRGNAIFETIRFKDDKLFDIDSHLDRLRKGLNYLEFKIDKTNDQLVGLILETIKKNNLNYGAVNLMVSNNFDINNLFDSKTNLYISVRSISSINHKLVKI